jgi:aminoglycoside phosphotransferase
MSQDDNKIIDAILSRNKITSENIHRYTSGINNKVYSIGEKYIIKIEGDLDHSKGILLFQKDLTETLLTFGAKTSKIYDYGEVEGKSYLLMEKIPGTNLVYDWLKFSIKDKENYIAQLADQLKIFHSIRFESYSIPITEHKSFSNLKDAIERVVSFNLIDKSKLKPEYVKEVEYLEQFYREHINLLDEVNTAVLVHSDLNLENILYDGDKVTGIIDFDWACHAPKDFELWKIAEVFREPKYSVEERLEPQYENYKMTEEFGFLRKHYPELFNSPQGADRVRMFYLNKIIDTVRYYQSGRWSEGAMFKVQKEIDDLFRNGWLESVFN